MDSRRESGARNPAMRARSGPRREPKPRRRRKSLRSLGDFMGRILKTLGTLAHLGDADKPEAEDDDGGFGLKDGAGPGGRSSGGSAKERLSWSYGDKTPGVLGLKNHGNTCFMNAVVQCLSNTDLLAEYLGLERYRAAGPHRGLNGELRPEEPRSARGEVTEQLASLVRGLWTLEYTPQLSVEFKSIVAKYGSQFRGNSQHDALEFLLWLLDRVHEDANSNADGSKTRTNAKVVSTESPSSPVGSGSQQPRGRHSFVQEHFQAQYRSSLTCPHCLKQSNTFDPFSCISLPIPLRQTRPLCVTLVFSTKGQRYLRVGLAVPLLGSVSSLRAMVAAEGSISPQQVILSELYSTGFQRSFSDDDDLTAISDSDVVYAFQAPPLSGRTLHSGYHHSLPSSPYSSSSSSSAGPNAQRLHPSGTLSSEYLNHGSSSKLLLLVCNTSGSGQQAVRFGPPFLMPEDRNVSRDDFQQNLLSKLYYLMLSGSQAQNIGRLVKVRVVGGSPSCSYLNLQDGRPLSHPAVDRALRFCGPGGPPHVKLVIEWESSSKESVFGSIQEEVVKDAESVRNQQQQHLQQHSCTLDQCFQLYTKEEQLAPDDAWKCPHCKQLQQGMVKMSLWTLPDILILHLKRFRQVGERRNKLSTLVGFPLTGLDMAPHVVKRSQSMKNVSVAPATPSWKPPSGQTPADMILPQEFLYDLYAVCNHHGGMHGGHYTAYCRNSVDGQWYSYDDSSVDLVPQDEVCTRGAYILFYQRRNTIPPWSASSSVSGSVSSSLSDHWLVRLTGDKRGSLVSRSSTSCPSSLPDAPDSPVFLPDDVKEEGGSDRRPFVRGLRGRSLSLRTPSRSKAPPLRWSFGSKDRRKPEAVEPDPSPAELVQYLESGRRPRCTKDPIVTLMNEPRGAKNAAATRSSSLGAISCIGRAGDEPPGQQGQRRLDKTSSPRHPGDESDGGRRKQSVSIQHGEAKQDKSRAEPTRNHDRLMSFLRGSFLRKDKESQTSRDEESVPRGDEDGGRRTWSRQFLPNGAAGGRTAEGGAKAPPNRLANGRTDIKRSQSSAHIPNKAEPNMRRTASLQRNGTSSVGRSLTSDPHRNRYSSSSLGRKRTVPESSF